MTTMPRCVLPHRRGFFRLSAAAVLALTAVAQPAWAQLQLLRPFPATALRGSMVVTQPPEILLNQKPARLAPGARIRGTDNHLLLSGTLMGQRLPVHYTLDGMGQLLNVWVLSPAEFARPWPSTPEQAAAWVFNPDAQTWSTR
jgi:predicted exporter